MAGVLRYTLVVRHPETLAATALLAGQSVPDWASDLVHPDDLEASKPDEDVAPNKAPAKRAAPSKPSK